MLLMVSVKITGPEALLARAAHVVSDGQVTWEMEATVALLANGNSALSGPAVGP